MQPRLPSPNYPVLACAGAESPAPSDVDRFPRCGDCAHPLMFHTKHGCTVRSSGNVDEPPSCCECDVAGSGSASWRRLATFGR